nr:hypothetical protein [Tanacetum cinerariifolium]
EEPPRRPPDSCADQRSPYRQTARRPSPSNRRTARESDSVVALIDQSQEVFRSGL